MIYLLKNVYLLLILLLLSRVNSYSDTADSLLVLHSKYLTKHKHFQADFTQSRSMSLFKKPLISTGTISFSYPDKILFHYKTPFESIILLTNNEMKRYHIENGIYVEQPSLEIVAKAITREIMRFLKGEFGKNMPFTVRVKDEKPRTFILIPTNAMAKTIFSAIEITFSKTREYIEQIRLVEQSGDYILIQHEEPSFEPIPDSQFSITNE